MTAKLGPTLDLELGPLAQLCSWDYGTGGILYVTGATDEQKAQIAEIVAANNPAIPDPRVLYTTAVNAGCRIVSTGTPALSGTYGIAPQDEINLAGLQGGIAASAPWLGGYRDQAGIKHTMTAAQFTEIATAILAYVAALDEAYATALSGAPWTWTAPAQPVTIA